MSKGQQLALRQLEAIAAAGEGLEILSVREPESEEDSLVAEVSLDCGGFEQRDGGIVLRQRERVELFVAADFPWAAPSVISAHRRWAGSPHVQWARLLCLYQAGSEWRPEDGMFGLLERLEMWLRRAALGELDPVGAPLHPPAVYVSGDAPRLVVRADAPEVGDRPWLGMARTRRASDMRIDVVGWSADLGEDGERLVPAVLLPTPIDWEYPEDARALLDALADRGVRWGLLLALLRLGSLSWPEGSGMPLIVGSPMRRGADGTRRQHVAAWYFKPRITWGIRASLAALSEDDTRKKKGEELEEILAEWADNASVAWCRVDEVRPEVTERRDSGSSLHRVFAGKKVCLWGCGAIGGHVAEWLVRAGVAQLDLYDKGVVSAGILARQPYVDADIGRAKARALADRLTTIDPDVVINARVENVLKGPLKSPDWHDGADFVIDATAAPLVASKLEAVRREHGSGETTVMAMIFGHTAEHGISVLAPPGHPGGPADLLRRVGLACTSRPGLGGFAEEFWPDPPRADDFQPEPGCSEPTFRGSGAEVAALAGTLLAATASDIAADASRASGRLLALPSAPHRGRRQAKLRWEPDTVLEDGLGRYQVRVSPAALRSIRAEVARNERAADRRAETGGVLFGRRDTAAGVLWIDEASGPPPDSIASPEEFVCGTAGVKDRDEAIRKRTRRATGFVGMWHTHPAGPAIPSPRDVGSMAELVSMEPLPETLMVICGGEPAASEIGAYVFAREELPKPFGTLVVSDRREPVAEPASPPRDVGLALSGGGSRAIAFHLGCLRALHDRGALERVRVVSGVSGGAVAAAAYAFGNGSFADFEEEVETLLRRGLGREVARRALLSPRLLSSTAAQVVSASTVLGTAARSRLGLGGQRPHPPARRWATRTDALEATLADRLFDQLTLNSPRREGLDVILTASDLRSGSAVRFGSRESGIWRADLGRIAEPIQVATAVAASAAYPLFLPSIDREFGFEGRGGERRRARVVLSDGGLFDNLGTSCLEPGRSSKYSYNVFDVDYVVACDAGRGILGDAFPVTALGRLSRSFEVTHRKLQDGARARLHRFAADGHLAGFAMPYLGQQDRALPYLPPDLVSRDEVVRYPTDFSPMSQANLDLLSRRGEQLTHIVIERWVAGL
ncbi:MAG: ThiF family adenylyltransferase [Actinobacteria bacterium]|nr:ThiF family adenylyltransferase [Actinomycetota bacterium]